MTSAADRYSETRKSTNPWQEDIGKQREALLREMWLDDVPTPEIARRIGCGLTRNAIIGKAMRMGLPARGRRDVEKEPVPVKSKLSAVPKNPGNRTQQDHHKSGMAPKHLKETSAALPPRPVRLQCLPVHILDLRPVHCRWPLWKHTGGHTFDDLKFCGAPADDGQSYCPHHRDISRGGRVDKRTGQRI